MQHSPVKFAANVAVIHCDNEILLMGFDVDTATRPLSMLN